MNATEISAGMSMLAVASVGDLAARPCAEVTTDAPLGRVVDEMKSHGRGCVLVVDGRTVVGIFTERDLLSRVDHSNDEWSQVVVGDILR